MKKLFATVALAFSLALAGSAASAATTPLTFNDGTTFFGNSYGSGTTGTSFSDSYTFTYTQAFDVASAVISSTLSNSSAVSITSFTLTDTATGTVYTGTSSGTSALQIFTIDASKLSSGAYTLTVLGTVLGSTGGSYGGNISISAVPEASTAAMMLGGLALVGMMATRRRKQSQSASFAPALMAA